MAAFIILNQKTERKLCSRKHIVYSSDLSKWLNITHHTQPKKKKNKKQHTHRQIFSLPMTIYSAIMKAFL